MNSIPSQHPIVRHRLVCQHVGLNVRDLKMVSRFYIHLLGFEKMRDYEVDAKIMADIFGVPLACQVRYLERNGFGIEFFFYKNGNLRPLEFASTGYHHWTLLVEDKYAFCEELKEKGVPVTQIAKSYGHTFFIKDPEGNLIEIKSYEA